VTELHVHDWSPWGPSPLSETAGVERRQRTCRGCDLTQDEPALAAPKGAVPDSAIPAATAVLRDLFRYPCADPQTSRATQELIECGACAACTRDWTPETEAVVAAAVPHIERAIRDTIGRRAAIAAFSLAAEEIHREALWQKGSQMRGMFANGETSINRLAMLEDIVRGLADRRVARGGEVTE
jgi:hypothetical protein